MNTTWPVPIAPFAPRLVANNFRGSSRLLQPRADDPIDDVAGVLADVVIHAAE
jgi:hypothetical protein